MTAASQPSHPSDSHGADITILNPAFAIGMARANHTKGTAVSLQPVAQIGNIILTSVFGALALLKESFVSAEFVTLPSLSAKHG
jgi:hypothetical protein